MGRLNTEYEKRFPAGTKVRITEEYADRGFKQTEKFVGLEGTVLDYGRFELYIGIELDAVPEGIDSTVYDGYLLVVPDEIEVV